MIGTSVMEELICFNMLLYLVVLEVKNVFCGYKITAKKLFKEFLLLGYFLNEIDLSNKAMI